ncbi:hypothetical protein [Bacillus sp. FJAT-44742]|uniref:hypothetical protein n=1 Tax=Bacillus sp. FJAT-44742 TaxID=2014005 RepID=UPI000C243914|nr:hypothetical protein [Bacillus sp. FJAT-44742]
MKKYSVYVKFTNNQDLQFETDTDIKKATTQRINGGYFIVTENDYILNPMHIKEMNVVKLR